MKSLTWLEAILYTLIAVCTPLFDLLSSDRPLTHRAMLAVSVACTIAGANALKAFLSTSFSKQSGELKKFLDDFTASTAMPPALEETTTQTPTHY